MATATVTITVVGRLDPWWMCKVKPVVTPCPVRPSGFVPFSEYDADFKFPLASSRKPSKVRRNSDCVSCRPGPVPEPPAPAPEPDPEPTCYTISSTNGEFDNLFSEIPGLEQEMTSSVFFFVDQNGTEYEYRYNEYNGIWNPWYEYPPCNTEQYTWTLRNYNEGGEQPEWCIATWINGCS